MNLAIHRFDTMMPKFSVCFGIFGNFQKITDFWYQTYKVSLGICAVKSSDFKTSPEMNELE